MELSNKVTVSFTQIWSDIQRFLANNRKYFEVYRVRAWIWSVFVPIILFVPTYLLLAAFDQFNFTSIVQFFLSLFLFITWIVAPGMFLYVNRGCNTISKIWFWTWLGLDLAFIIVWIIVFT
ncbi:hypothetical protein ACTWQL_00695 [Pseudalkalibacillus sp. R45]|uniref:hypothetical protein n=1 Tax=Pseudalkalibacillus sp. R45 TaxID=3457433 RepID=UPI003FCC86D9